MIKIPKISSKKILEILRKREFGVGYAYLGREYGVSYHDIKKIEKYFSNCNFEKDVDDEIEKINTDNAKCAIKDHKANYQRHKEYYKQYSKKQYRRRIAQNSNITTDPTNNIKDNIRIT